MEFVLGLIQTLGLVLELANRLMIELLPTLQLVRQLVPKLVPALELVLEPVVELTGV